MSSFHVVEELVLAWQTAHSVARGSPAPVRDRGGFRVDTDSETEVKRWVFPGLCEGLSEIAHEIAAPRHYLKLCGSDEQLRSALPGRWQIQPANYFMMSAAASVERRPLPEGYRIEVGRTGTVVLARVIAPDGGLAASGYAAETVDAFVYDRIETAPDHRRKGLGVAVMAALSAAQRSPATPQLLVATADGRGLYASLGWTVLAPLACAAIAES
ncbi:GNAT family N-acetyltransferase [Pseudomonas sp. CGJS7]|uniref:GNAT family N-acetyltransferase n=1 Tax=Pseudomonas sp. CGJS7 TaxID=3109348 RepID=UPI00300836CB